RSSLLVVEPEDRLEHGLLPELQLHGLADPLALAVAAEPLDELNGPRSPIDVEDPWVSRVIQLGDELLVLLPHALRYDGFSRLDFIPIELDVVLHSLTEPVTLRTP